MVNASLKEIAKTNAEGKKKKSRPEALQQIIVNRDRNKWYINNELVCCLNVVRVL